jgi:hypothetical protein
MNKFIKLLNDICKALIPESQVYVDVKRNKQLWKEFCEEKNGNLQIKNTNDFAFSNMRMRLPYDDSEISFRESDTNLLKIEYCFTKSFDFSFQISFEDFIEKTIKLISKTEVEIGDKHFDNKYLISTNNREKLKGLLSNNLLRELLLLQNISNFQFRNKDGKGTIFILGGRHVTKMESLHNLYEIVVITIEYLNNNP